MKKSKNAYNIHIRPEFLFDSDQKFRSPYTRLVYIYYKLIFNIVLQGKGEYKMVVFKIDYKHLQEVLGIKKSLIDKCLRELKNHGLMTTTDELNKSNPEMVKLDLPPDREGYIIFSEENKTYGKTKLSFDFGKTEFIKIHKNFFIEALKALIKYYADEGVKTRTKVAKTFELYFYLIFVNRHYCSKEGKKPIFKNITGIKICKDLSIRRKDLLNLLTALRNCGMISKDDSGIYTVSQRTFLRDLDFERNKKKFSKPKYSSRNDFISNRANYEKSELSDQEEEPDEYDFANDNERILA